MYRIYLLLLIFAVILSGCASVPTKDIKTQAQLDPKTNFKAYKTYAWIGTAAVLNDPYGEWKTPSFDAMSEVKYQVDRQLHKRGMSESSTNPDMLVAFAAGIDMDTYKLKVDPASKINIISNVPTGGIVIVLADKATGTINYAAVATAEIKKNPDTKTAKARLDYAVNGMFKELPK